MFNSYTDIKLTTRSDTVSSLSSILSPGNRIERAFSLLESNMEKALDGSLEPAIYVLSADCGTGKGTTVQQFFAAWKARNFAGEGSVIIFVQSYDEIDAYVDRAGLDRVDYAVHSSNATYRNRGAGLNAVNEVPILFATHAKARRLLNGLARFEDAAELHHKGRARTLRIWDEAFLPADYASFGLNDLRGLPKALERKVPVEFIRAVERLLPDKAEIIAGHKIIVPMAMVEIADTVLRSGNKLGADHQNVLEALGKLAGSTATLSGSDESGWNFIGIGLPIPVDIGPLFVLDASARLSGRYKNWSRYGLSVVHLEPAPVEYGPLAIKCVDAACGTTAMRDPGKRRAVFKIAASIMNSKPNEDFLLVMKKEFVPSEGGLPKELSALIRSPEKVYVTTWGRHLGLNTFKDIANVILIGDYGYSNAAYDSISTAAVGKYEVEWAKSVRRETKAGEFKSNMYQAVCRIRVRHQRHGVCRPATAYLLMPDSNERRDQLRETFPGCSIEGLVHAESQNKRKVDLVLDVLIRQMENRTIVPAAEITAECGSNDRGYLTKIYKNVKFIDTIKAKGIKVRGQGPAKMFVRTGISSSVAA